ncbi:hypothetical protein HDU88_008758 [Geranomyces variabilis]|nr:hypothetical protein HDU88_008758 [Geranomyces variabilis]
MLSDTIAPKNSLWSTLRDLTSIKRNELAKQRDAVKALRQELVAPLSAVSDPRARVELLLQDAGKRVKNDRGDPDRPWAGHRSTVVRKGSALHTEILALAGISARNTQRFLAQSNSDSSIQPSTFSTVENRFQKALDAFEIKYSYAILFADLVTEKSGPMDDSELDASPPEMVGREEMHTQRKEWESLVFSEDNMDEAQILSHLKKVFSSPEAEDALKNCRAQFADFGRELQDGKIDLDAMKATVDGLASADLLSYQQLAILKQARDSPVLLSELTDVLHLRLSLIESWTWGAEVPLEMRRQLSGKYRVYMEEELTDALLIHYVGMRFVTKFAALMDSVYDGSAWTKHSQVNKSRQALWDYYIGHRDETSETLKEKIDETFKQNYFLSAIPRSEREGVAGYDCETRAGENKPASRVSRAVEAKQALLHIIAAEPLIADHVNEELVVFQTDFKWFGPSLSHTAIKSVLKFFGVTDVWLGFFERFLKAPLRFLRDGPNGEIRVRQRGVPMSHMLSSFFGESVLFCLDFAVNEATNGKPMYRLHDDIFFWGTPVEASSAWKALTTLSQVLGISVNDEKTGAGRLSALQATHLKESIPECLPSGELRWGLLSLRSDGKFAIDQSRVDEHIIEMHRQLAGRRSVLDWIRAYNRYMQFFAFHFCRPQHSLGRSHIDDCLRTFSRINREICPSTDGNTALFVKKMLLERFKFGNVPDGFLFWPMKFGGLELHNPFVTLQGLRDHIDEAPEYCVKEALDREELRYREFELQFEREGPAHKRALADRPETFMDRATYALFRRDRSASFLHAWTKLLASDARASNPSAVISPVDAAIEAGMPECSPELNGLLDKMKVHEASELRELINTPYWRTVLELYGAEMSSIFGSVQVVERSLLPMGMVEALEGKVRWES